jgi:hypothetical protein
MSQIALVADADVPIDDTTLALWADAFDRQVAEFAQAWGVPYTPVIYYKSSAELPIDCRIALITMSLGVPGAEGYHDDQLGIVFSRIAYQGPDDTPGTGSHENTEEVGDPTCDRWAPWDDQHEQAMEAADRVEGDFYLGTGKVGTLTRDVPLSNFLYPSAFDPKGKPPFDKMGKLERWNGMTEGGYVILRNKQTGETTDVFARARRAPYVLPASPKADSTIARKMRRPDSRMMRRLRG